MIKRKEEKPMKKKLTGLLVALMVLSMGTTVFAAQSPDSNTTVEQKAQQLRDSVSNVKTSRDGVSVEVKKADAGVVADANEKATSFSSEAEMLGMVELESDKDFSQGVTLTFYVAGVKSGDNVRILHKLANGTWEVIVPYVGDGYVRATFYSLSPVAIVKYPQGVSVPSTQQVTDPAGSTDTTDNAGNQNSSSNNANKNDSQSANNSQSSSNDQNANANTNSNSENSSASSKSDSKSNSKSDSKASANANVNVNINNNSNSKNNSNSNSGSSNRPTSGGSGVATSPKTGQAVPVLPIVAVFALMGGTVVCSKKAKSL